MPEKEGFKIQIQPVFAGYRVRGDAVSAGLFDRGLGLPSGRQMTDNDLARVVGIIESCR